MAEERVDEESEQEKRVSEVTLVLRRSREEKGLSLQEVEAATRIPLYYLQLLEGTGDSRLLANAMYLVPFLRTYALFLGLDPTYAVVQFIQLILSKEQEDVVSNLGPPRASSRAYTQTVIVALVLASLALLVFLWVTQWG